MSFPPVVPPTVIGSNVYAPAARVLLTVTGEVLTAFSPGPASLSFVAPPSGNVNVRAVGHLAVTTGSVGNLGWLLHDTAEQIGVSHVWSNGWGTADYVPLAFEQVLSGLVPGQGYELDLAGANGTATTDVIALACQGVTGVGTVQGGPLALLAVAL